MPEKTKKKQAPIRHCAWCPKDFEPGRVEQCPKCHRWYCSPINRDCMFEHPCR